MTGASGAPPLAAELAVVAGRGDIRGIQFLRGIAALMVVAHHARHYFPQGDHWIGFGSRGVDIFFVVSGFIMAHSTRRYDESGRRGAQAADFLRRRFLRVVPLYWLALLWTAKGQALAHGFDADLLRDLAFVPHFHALYRESVFPTLVPGWTINYEMFFYLLFGCSLLLGRGRYVVLSTTLCVLAAIGTIGFDSAPAIFYTRTVLLEFVLGMAVYACLRRWPRPLTPSVAIVVSLVSLALLAIENGDELRGVLDGPFAALLVWSFVQWTARLKLAWLHVLGDASYSIYLFHLAALAVPTRALRWLGIVEPTPVNVVAALGTQVAFAAACGILIYLLVERPLLRLSHSGAVRPAPP